VHDLATLNSGSFAATIRGFSLLKEAGSGFIVQIIPMKDSYHQMEEMIALAKSLNPHYHLGSLALFVC
jgi:MoaA/NifB/PqqE/SkfB family radical SAM enzyme